MVSTQSKCSRCHDKVQGSALGATIHPDLRTGMYTLKSETNVLAERAYQRQTGKVP